jgi:hypothetical protein
MRMAQNRIAEIITMVPTMEAYPQNDVLPQRKPEESRGSDHNYSGLANVIVRIQSSNTSSSSPAFSK